MFYAFPQELNRLRRYMASKHVDVNALKSDRQALLMASRVTGYPVRYPMKGKSCFLQLLKIQRLLFPNKSVGLQAQNKEHREQQLGRFGAANEGRTIAGREFERLAAQYEAKNR